MTEPPPRSEYLKTLDALSRMRDQCQGELALPQICVVGDQTSGKSSLLHCVTGVPFPVKSGICTRAPCVVQCRNAESELCEIRGSPNAAFEEIRSDDIKTAIGKAQRALLNEHGGLKVSKKEITLRISGPEQIDIQIVDLPGIIHNGDGKDETVQLINSYIASPQTLILLVSEAKQDDELTSALALAAKHDPDQSRTLRVLTKFDTFDTEDARTAAARLVVAEEGVPLGPHAVVCRANGDDSYDEDNEREELDHCESTVAGKLPEGRKGIPALKSRLPDVFTTLIRTNLKGLEQAANARIQQSLKALRKLGEHPLGDVAMIRECQRVLSVSSVQFQEVITPAFYKFQEAVHATEDRVTAEFIMHYITQDAFQCPFFQGEAVFSRCMREIVNWWREPARRFEKDIQRALADSMAPIECDAIGVSKKLRAAIDERWAANSEAIMKRLSAAFKEALDESVPFGTANHYLHDKYVEETSMPTDMLEDILATIRAGHGLGVLDRDDKTFPTSMKNIRHALESVRNKHSQQDRLMMLQDHVAKRVLRAVKAAWAVEKKTVTDAILKKTRDLGIRPRDEWISSTLLVDDHIRMCAVEDDDVGAQRAHNTQVIKAMKSVLVELAQLSNGDPDPSSPLNSPPKKRPIESLEGATLEGA